MINTIYLFLKQLAFFHCIRFQHSSLEFTYILIYKKKNLFLVNLFFLYALGFTESDECKKGVNLL